MPTPGDVSDGGLDIESEEGLEDVVGEEFETASSGWESAGGDGC